MTEGGKICMPLIGVWMTRGEIADMFGLPEAPVSVIRMIWSMIRMNRLNHAYDLPQ